MNDNQIRALRRRVLYEHVRDLEDQIEELEDEKWEREQGFLKGGFIIIDGNPECDPVARDAWYLDVDELEPTDEMCDIIRWTFGLEIVASGYDRETNKTMLRVTGDNIESREQYHVLVDERRNEARLLDSNLNQIDRDEINHLQENHE